MKDHPKALVIDDEQQICRFIGDVLRNDGWDIQEATNADRAFEMLAQDEWALVFCDVMLGETNGYQILKRFAASGSKARFVIMTGQGSAADALDATAFGAYDYLLKPISVADVQKIAKAALEQNKQRANPKKTNKNSPKFKLYGTEIPLIGKSPEFVKCLKTVGRVAVTNLPVLITGESGTGKEVVAQAIHCRSRRAGKPFVAVNCSAIPVELIESELFGHARGAFTGAQIERRGLWEEAEGGTIFLDEITETNPLFQVKLLRALQEGEIRRVGSNRTTKTDVRVIAATNRNVEEEVSAGRFRQDLMYRLNAITIELPPLRERREDVPLLIEFFADRLNENGNSPVEFSPDALKMMESYRWNGNVRELENAVLHAVSLGDRIIRPEHLPIHIRKANNKSDKDIRRADSATNDSQSERWISLAEMETEYAARVLAHTNGNKQAAARILDIDRKTLIRILDRANISKRKS